MTDPPVKHRLTAILAADAVGFSRLMAMDEGATVAALDAARALFRQHVGAHHGRVVDMAGDSVLAVFDAATAAVDAALAVQQALALATQPVAEDRRMRFRIGVHLGDVVEKADGTVYGDGVNVAARLQALADPGGITVSEAVRGVVLGRVDARFRDRGEQQLKNIAMPVHAYAVALGTVDAAADPARVAAREAPPLAQRPPPRAAALFVGRSQEIAQLAKALDSARRGQGQVVLLAGSGGMGKTRLAQEMAARAEAQGVSVLWGRCLEEPGAPPYWPWRQLIRGYLRAGGDPRPAETLGAGLPDIVSIVPEVAESVPLRPAAAHAEALDTAQSRFQLFDAVAGFWRRAARRMPQVLIFEDLHWADATSLRLFAFLATELEDSALLLIGTYRDTELSRQHPLFDTLGELARSPVLRRIELAGLSERETQEFIAAASGGLAGAQLADAIHARTEGHPLFLEETMRFMTETRTPNAPGSMAELLQKIPTGVREVIGKRLNRLSVPASRLLSIAACIGRVFELDLLAGLDTDKSEDEVLVALEEALAVHLIEPVPHSRRFRFSHALIRECIYDEMLGLRRARLHLRIAEILEARDGADRPAVLPQLAYHFSEAGPGAAAKALAYARQSAEHAAQLLAFEEAARLYRLALHLQQQHFGKDAAERCGLLLKLAEVEMLLGAGEPARAACLEAAGLARGHGLATLFAQAAMGFELSNVESARSGELSVALLLEALALHRADDPLRVELLAHLCRAYVYCNLADEAKDAHRRAVALARQIGDRQGLCLALTSIAAGVYWPDQLREHLAAASEAWGIADSLNLPRHLLRLLPYFLMDLIRIGDVATLARVRAHGLRRAQATGALHEQAICNYVEGVIAISEGRFADAEAWAGKALAIGRRANEALAVGVYGMQMFCLRREQGRLRETLPLLQHFVRTTPQAQTWVPGLAVLYAELDMRAECEAQFESLPWDRALTSAIDASTMTVMMFAAEVCVYLGDAARAAVLYPVLKGYAGANLVADSGGPCLGSADRLLGGLAMVMRQWVVAQRHFEAALAMDSQTGSRTWLAHSRFAYAVMLHRRALAGDTDRARTLLAEAQMEATALGMQALKQRIAALADTFAAPPPVLPCGLTERELGVLRLIAMGRNNREIGQVLQISPNTVANHVRSILEKTYTANRTEAAAFARREGLLNE
ncbi:AAA family ATPase [Variovorax sp. dw_308]|uniref:helix-turn-helix transcriptional regulator n=1 Tax=Variovorax sp. dw_308 TaxID=2721546 RepID=UPI001C43ECFD|nr:AAA family ATPase [Variovorax sp. dw_308]